MECCFNFTSFLKNMSTHVDNIFDNNRKKPEILLLRIKVFSKNYVCKELSFQMQQYYLLNSCNIFWRSYWKWFISSLYFAFIVVKVFHNISCSSFSYYTETRKFLISIVMKSWFSYRHLDNMIRYCVISSFQH